MISEFERQCRVIDQMITAHSALRDRYERLALLQDVIVLILSTALTATVLFDPTLWPWLRLTADEGRLAIGAISVLVFASTVVGLRVRWKERSAAHDVAASGLSELKSAARLIDAASYPELAREWLEEAIGALKAMPEVPESRFLRLKARHLRKIALSRLVDEFPGTPILILRCRLLLSHSARAFQKQNTSDDER